MIQLPSSEVMAPRLEPKRPGPQPQLTLSTRGWGGGRRGGRSLGDSSRRFPLATPASQHSIAFSNPSFFYLIPFTPSVPPCLQGPHLFTQPPASALVPVTRILRPIPRSRRSPSYLERPVPSVIAPPAPHPA